MKDMALQNYDSKVNCIIAAKTFYAVVTNQDAKLYFENWVQEHRGLLLKQAKVNIQGGKGDNTHIPCKGGKVCWNDIKQETGNHGTIYKLQQYKGKEKVKTALKTRNGHVYSNDADVHHKE